MWLANSVKGVKPACPSGEKNCQMSAAFELGLLGTKNGCQTGDSSLGEVHQLNQARNGCPDRDEGMKQPRSSLRFDTDCCTILH